MVTLLTHTNHVTHCLYIAQRETSRALILLCKDLCLSVCILCVFILYCIFVVLLWARWWGTDGIEA